MLQRVGCSRRAVGTAQTSALRLVGLEVVIPTAFEQHGGMPVLGSTHGFKPPFFPAFCLEPEEGRRRQQPSGLGTLALAWSGEMWRRVRLGVPQATARTACNFRFSENRRTNTEILIRRH